MLSNSCMIFLLVVMRCNISMEQKWVQLKRICLLIHLCTGYFDGEEKNFLCIIHEFWHQEENFFLADFSRIHQEKSYGEKQPLACEVCTPLVRKLNILLLLTGHFLIQSAQHHVKCCSLIVLNTYIGWFYAR